MLQIYFSEGRYFTIGAQISLFTILAKFCIIVVIFQILSATFSRKALKQKKKMRSDLYPKNQFSHQNGMSYQLTDQDLLQLYALFTPAEILKEFNVDRVRCQKSIYNLVNRYGLDKPFLARRYLQRMFTAACPEEVGFSDWDAIYEKKICYVRAEALARLWKRISKHEALWAED